MDPLRIFHGSKPFRKLEFPSSTSSSCNRLDMSALDGELNKTCPSTIASDTDYVTDYVKAEEERMLSESGLRAVEANSAGHTLEEVSTAAPLPHESETEELNKIYGAYNFDYQPNDKLPIILMKNHIVSMIETRNITIIQGPTGCGKTTQVPQFILDSCYEKRAYCNIIVTQPRRIAAISIAKRVSEERKWELGSLVGFQVGMVSSTSEDTRLTYCTTGVLLRKLISAKHMHDYTHVIIDEVHERDQDMDFLLLVVRKLQRTNSRNVKVILMSATFNVHKFANYFTSPSGDKLLPASIINISEENFFKVHDYYLCQMGTLGSIPEVFADEPKATPAMMKFCCRILRIFDHFDITENHRSAVLVFLPGISEIEEMHDLLSQEAEENNPPLLWDVLILHSTITNEEQQRIFEQPENGYRRIILATNVAESSITVPDIKYVIDFCLMKQLVTDPTTNYQCLELSWASKTNCEQRAGRAGRLMDGRVYRLVSENFYKNVLPEEGAPEMLRAPLENVVLNAKLLDMGEPKEILALSLDPPNLSNIERTILLLKESGALLNKDEDGDEVSKFDGNLTDLGRIMAALPFDIHISKLIALGHVFSVLREAIIIGASMSVKNMFSAPLNQKLEAFTAKLVWANHSNSDCVAFLNAYTRWMIEKANQRLKTDTQEKRWAQRSFLQIKVLREIEALVHEVIGRLRYLGISETVGTERVVLKEDEKALVIKIVIAGAFYPHFYRRKTNKNEKEGVQILAGRDPTRTVYLQGWPTNQPGPLYARRIQEYFKDCVDSKVAKILVSFDNSSRVYVQFRKNEAQEEENFDNNEEPGEISLAVYKAIKLRSIARGKSFVQIPVLNSDASFEVAEKLDIKQDPRHVFAPTETANKQRKQQQQPEISGIRPVLPGLDLSYIPLIIRRVVTPGHFWAQLRDDETASRLHLIQSTINAPDSAERFPVLKGAPKIGSLVIAPRETSNKLFYHRAIIQNVTIETKTELLAKVLCVDYGNVVHVRVCDLRELDRDSEIARIPALAFECVLAEIRASSVGNLSGNQSWSQEATDEFHRLLSADVLIYGQVYSVVDSVVYLKLIRTDAENKSLELNDHFVKLGYAEPKEEEYLSRCNHELRDNYTKMSLARRQYYEDLQYEQTDVSDTYPEPPALKDCRSSVELRGPTSPLEIALASLNTAGLGMRVNIGNCSVNSVLLDANPEDPHDRLLVAGSVQQAPAGHSLTLRNTTLMPNIPGLTSLLCLMFSPKMELRRNTLASRYTGALCGLGYDSTTENSLFPEHDLSIHFDTEITMDDLQDINRLRHWMGLGIYTNRESGNTGSSVDGVRQTSLCQNRLKNILFALLEKRRNPATRQLDSGFDRWCRYDDSSFILPGRDINFKRNIFQLHAALDLKEKNDEREEMIANILELRELSTRHFRDSSTAEVLCKLCNSTIEGVFELRLHINTATHIINELKYHPLHLV